MRKYRPGEKQTAHRDESSRISIILSGEVAEESSWANSRLSCGDVLFKSRDVVHENRFGASGASILSIVFSGGPDCPFSAARLDGAWIVKPVGTLSGIGIAAVEAAVARDDATLSAAVADLLVGACSRRRGSVPKWLSELYAVLQDVSLAQVEIGAVAKAAGRHPVSVSRAFRQCYGVSITEHAARQGVRRALAALAQGQMDLATLAATSGFYDQSHMTKVFRRLTGRTPGVHRSRIAAAPTSDPALGWGPAIEMRAC
jgi:AraC family transcriptional regulator